MPASEQVRRGEDVETRENIYTFVPNLIGTNSRIQCFHLSFQVPMGFAPV